MHDLKYSKKRGNFTANVVSQKIGRSSNENVKYFLWHHSLEESCITGINNYCINTL